MKVCTTWLANDGDPLWMTALLLPRAVDALEAGDKAAWRVFIRGCELSRKAFSGE